MKNHRAAWSLLVVLAFALAVFFADSGVANARTSSQACKATAVAQQTCQDTDAQAAPCAKHAKVSVQKNCKAEAASKCTKACAKACAKVCASTCGTKCTKACAPECKKICATKCGTKNTKACASKCSKACCGSCGAGCKLDRAAVCGPRCRSVCHGAKPCDCGKVSCRLYGFGCGHAKPMKAKKWARAKCQQPCCQAKGVKAFRMQASACGQGCQEACCASPCKVKKVKRISKCKPGCREACCAAPHKEHKKIRVKKRGTKCAPGCKEACCAAPRKVKKMKRVSECKPGCKEACCAATSTEMTIDCHLEGTSGEHVFVAKAGDEDHLDWVEALHSGDHEGQVKKILIQEADVGDVKEIYVDKDGLWHDEDMGDIHIMKAGAGQIAWLGVHLQDLTPELREAFDLPSSVEGALITDVDRSGPARKSGIRKGFVVVEFDGVPIHSAEDLIKAVRASEPGDRVTVVMNRNGNKITRRVTLGSRAGEVKIHRDLDFDMPDIRIKMPKMDELIELDHIKKGRGGFLGVSAEELSEREREKLGLPEDMGIEIQKVHEGTAADHAGLEEGDIIAKVDDDGIEDVDDLVKAISSKEPGDTVTLFLLRDGEKKKMDVELGERELPETLKLVTPRKAKMWRSGKGLEQRRNALMKELKTLHKKLQKLEDELEELDEKLEQEEED